MIVAKFGGTSVSTKEGIQTIRMVAGRRGDDATVVVVSALAGVTDLLFSAFSTPHDAELAFTKIRERHETLVREVFKDEPTRVRVMAYVDEKLKAVRGSVAGSDGSEATKDTVISYGEIMSSYFVSEAVSASGSRAQQVIATELIVTDDRFGDAEFIPGPTKENAQKVLVPLLEAGMTPVVTGFIGRAPDGRTTTLGRGGSDYTASILGLSLGANSIEIWKEVDGIMTTDPRIVPTARVVPELAFEEACELAYFGAKVLHPKTILPAMEADIPVKVLNTFNPSAPGTTIVSNFFERKMKSHTVEAFSFKKHITIIHVRSPEFFDGNGLMARIFALFEKYRTSVDVIATSVVSISLTIDDETNLEPLLSELSAFGQVSVEREKAIVCVVGGSINAAGVAGEMFTALGKSGIAVAMISQAASGVSTTFVVDEHDAEKAIRVLHETYIGK